MRSYSDFSLEIHWFRFWLLYDTENESQFLNGIHPTRSHQSTIFEKKTPNSSKIERKSLWGGLFTLRVTGTSSFEIKRNFFRFVLPLGLSRLPVEETRFKSFDPSSRKVNNDKALIPLFIDTIGCYYRRHILSTDCVANLVRIHVPCLLHPRSRNFWRNSLRNVLLLFRSSISRVS